MAGIRDRAWFLWVAFSLPAVIALLQSVAPFEPTFRAQNIAIWFGILGALVVLALWVPFRSLTPEDSSTLRIFVALVALIWLYQNVMELLDGYSFNHTTYFVPLFLLLVFLRPPKRGDFYIAGLFLGYSLILIALISLIFGGRWGIPSGFDGPDSGASRFLGVSEFFGIETRWGGPFGSVNYSTPVGGLLLLLGVLYRRWNRWIFVSMAVVILFLGQARTTYFALAIAILVLILWSHRFSALRHSGVIRWFSIAAASVAVFAYIFVVDPTFNGRTPIWIDYWSEVSASLIPGIGSSGVTEYVAQASLIDPSGIFHMHAHSIFLDGLTRYGIFWLVGTIAIFAVAFVAAWRARGGSLGSRGLAMVTFIFLAGSTETIYSWSYVTVYLLTLIFIVGLSGPTTKHDAKESEDRSHEVEIKTKGFHA